MPPILFPNSSAPGKDRIESSGRLINAYAEPLQEGAPGPTVIRRTPGLTAFCSTAETGFRGMWYDGDNYVYAAWSGELFYIDSTGTETSVGALQGARIAYLHSEASSANATIYTYTAVTLGTAHFNRRIIVGIFAPESNDLPVASVTIGGVAATEVRDRPTGTGSTPSLSMWIALVPTGTTGDIVVTYATATTRSAIGVWRLDGAASNVAYSSGEDEDVTVALETSISLNIPDGGAGVAIGASAALGSQTWGGTAGFTEDFEIEVEATSDFTGASLTADLPVTATVTHAADSGSTAIITIAAVWRSTPNGADAVTFAKNNATTPDQVLCTPTLGAFTFTTSAITVLNVNGEVPNSVCFGEGYFFFTTTGGLCYASGINVTTVNALDVCRAEARPEALVRGVFFNGELYLFGETHTEVWASGGNPNLVGFPLNRTTVIWRGLIATLAVCGFEEGFHPGLIFVGDDNSVHLLQGYTPVEISIPSLNRAIEACADKTSIRMFIYHVDGHACAGVDLAGEGTWVYDLTTGFWHERDTNEQGYWRATGNGVRAFEKWLVGDRDSGNIYEVSTDALDDGTVDMPFIVESVAMEAFPSRIQISRADFNFVTGVGTSTVLDPKVKISWSDDGGHTWSNPVERKLGEAGRYFERVRVNRLGLTKSKGRRFRLRIDDEVYVGLLAGSMEGLGLP